MQENENLVTDVTENVEEQTTEENQIEEQDNTVETDEVVEEPKIEPTYTKEQVDEIVQKRLARNEAKLRKEYNKKYGRLETVVNAGLGTTNVDEAADKLTDFYAKKGISVPEYKDSYTDREVEILANADADEVISLGYDDIADEIERLENIGLDNMSKKDKIIYSKLSAEKQRLEDVSALKSIGVDEELLDSDEFIDFTKKLNPNLTMKEKYDLYVETRPKKEIKQIGSMKNTPVEKTIKEYYTPEEARKLTDDDFKKHPELYKIIEESMTKWK